MTRPGLLALLTVAPAVLASACTTHTPEAQSVELSEPAPERTEFVGFEHAPMAELSRDDQAPWLELRTGADPDYDDGYICDFQVVPHNFPAVSEDGEQVAHASIHVDGNADITDEYMNLTWTDVESDRSLAHEQVYARGEHPYAEPENLERDCAPVIEEIRSRVDELNHRLAETKWRPMQKLALEINDPDAMWDDDEDEPDVGILPASARPVEAMYRNGYFIARVPGMRLLDRQERMDWRQWDEFCDTNPHLTEIWGDRLTGASLVSYNHSSGGCLCDDHEYFSAITLAPAVFNELDRRSQA